MSSGSDEAESDEPTAQALFESGSAERRNDGDLSSGDKDGPAKGREYTTSNWTLVESLVLHVARRKYLEKDNSGPKRKSEAERWQVVEDYCWLHGIHRSGTQCSNRWDKISAEFKKISEFEKQNVAGQKKYWSMTSEEKEAKRLPFSFWLELFTAMNEWFGRNKNIDFGPRPQDDNHEDGSDPESIPVMELSDDEEIKTQGAHERKFGRDYSKRNWTQKESMVLLAAKQDEFLRHGKGKNIKAPGRWQVVEDFCFAQNVYRSDDQCRFRWGKLSLDFKKIDQYQQHATDDARNYWNLTAEEKKSKKLPRAFFEKVFVEMSKWFPKDWVGRNENIVHDSEAQQQEDSGKAGSSEGLSDSDQGNSDPFVDSRPRKRRKASIRTNEPLAEILKLTQKVLFEQEDREDQRLQRSRDVSERTAVSNRAGLDFLAYAIRSVAPRDPQSLSRWVCSSYSGELDFLTRLVEGSNMLFVSAWKISAESCSVDGSFVCL